MGKVSLKYFFLSISIIVSLALKAQECEWLEIAAGNGIEISTAVCVDADNNYLVSAYFTASFSVNNFSKTYNFTASSNGNALLIKYKPDGEIIWAIQNTYNSSTSYSQFTDVETDASKNIYVLGLYVNDVNFGNGVSLTAPSSGKQTVFIVKYNPNGAAQWAKSISSASSSGTITSGKLTLDNQNNCIIGFSYTNTISIGGTSQTLSNSGGQSDVGIVKYSTSGAFINATTIGGSSGAESFIQIDTDAANNIYVMLDSRGTLTTGTLTFSDSGMLVLKIDSGLNSVAGIKYNTRFGIGNGLTVSENGKFLVVGTFRDTVNFGGIGLKATNGGTNKINSYIVYYDSNFTPIWAKKDNPISSASAAPNGGVTLRNGFIYFGGVLQAGNTYFGNSILQWVPSSFNMYLVKMDTLGNFLWAFNSGVLGGASITTGIAVDLLGETIVTGRFTKKITVFNLSDSTPFSNENIFVAKITDYSITRGNVSAGPYCAGDSLKIPYTKTGKYDTGNVFIAQLSDSAGNFDGGERELGRIKDTAGGEIKGLLPLFDVATTTKYRIRIISTKPVVQSFFRRDTLRLLIFSKDTANAGPDKLVCWGEPIRLGTTGGSKWQWFPPTFMPNLADTANRQPLIKPDSALEYRIIISDSSGCGLTDTDYVKITIRPDLDIQIEGLASVCRGQVVTLRAKPTGGDGTYWYQWITVGSLGTPITTDSLVVSPDTTTTYRLVLGDSCTAKNDTAFFTLQIDTVLTVFITNDTTICKGTKNFPLNAWGSGCDTSQYKFRWTKTNDTATIIGSSYQIFVSPDSTTNYRVILQDTGTMLSDTAFVRVKIDNIFIATITQDSTICKGQSLALETGAISCDTSLLGFVWNNGLDTLKTHTVSPATTTTYTAIVTNKFNGLKDTASVTITVRPPLKVTVNVDSTICKGQTAELRATTTGGDTSKHTLVWSEVGGLWSVVGKNTMVNPSKTTAYRALLTDGCTVLGDSAEIKITVRDSLKVSVNTDTTICLGESTQIRATLSGGNSPSYSLLWTADSGPWANTNPNVTVTPTATTTYKALLTDGCTTPNDSNFVTITVRPPLKVTVNGKTNACPGETISLTAQASGGDSNQYSYTWVLPDGSTNTAKIITVNPSVTSTYKIIINDNCSASDSINHVIILPTPITITTPKDTTICDGWSVPLFVNVSGGIPATYKTVWEDVSSGFSDTNAAIVVKPTTTTQYSITVSDGCSVPQKDTVLITVLPSPKASFSLENNIGCEPLMVTTQDLSQNHDTLFNVWKTNSLIKEGRQPALYYNKAGKYDVELVVKNNLGCSDSSRQTGAVVVNPLPISNFIVSPVVRQIEEEITFTNLSVGATNYKWLLGENDSIETPNKTPINKIYKDTGDYEIQLISITANNCSDTAISYIRLVDLFTVIVPNAFSPNGDLLNDIFGPVNTGTLSYKMTLFTRWGEVIYSCECGTGCANPCVWDGTYKESPVPQGVYFYILNLESETRTKRNIMGSVVLVR